MQLLWRPFDYLVDQLLHSFRMGSVVSCFSARFEWKLSKLWWFLEFESMGSLLVSFLLIGTSVGIGQWFIYSPRMYSGGFNQVQKMVAQSTSLFRNWIRCTFTVARSWCWLLSDPGIHSYHLLLDALANSSMDLSFLSILPNLAEVEEELTDPRAMWFAAGSVLVKEYLYRITMK